MYSKYVHQKKEAVCALLLQGNTPPFTNFLTYPLCFNAFTFCEVTSQLFSLKWGGASDPKSQTLTTDMLLFNQCMHIKQSAYVCMSFSNVLSHIPWTNNP